MPHIHWYREDKKIEPPIIASIITIVGGGVIAYIVHRLTIGRERRNRHAAACSAFRAAFNDELAALQSRGGMVVDTRSLLLSAHSKHSAAIEEFKRHIFWRRRCLDKHWKQYHYGHAFDPKAWGFKDKDSIFLQYVSVNDTEEQSAKTLAVKNIHALLRFAKET